MNAFKKALETLVQKHPAFRTVFITRNATPVVQVVKKSLTFSIIEQDISHIKSDEQEDYIDVVMKQDRQNLFNMLNKSAIALTLQPTEGVSRTGSRKP